MQEHLLRQVAADLDIHISGRNRNGWLICGCPFAPYLHEGGRDHNPSFCLHADDHGPSGFNCFTCKEKGSIAQLATKLGTFRGESYRKLLVKIFSNELLDDFGTYERTVLTEVPLKPLSREVYLHLYPKVEQVREAWEYLRDRGVGKSTARKLRLRYDEDQQRILFPVFDSYGDLFGFSGRSILDVEYSREYPKVRDYAGLRKDMLLLNEQNAQPGLPSLVVEGLFAVAHMEQEGVSDFVNVLATMQSHLSTPQLHRLIDLDQPVYFLYDKDEAGQFGLFGHRKADGTRENNGAVALTRKHLPTFVCKYPRGVTDPDDLLYHHVHKMVLRGKSERY